MTTVFFAATKPVFDAVTVKVPCSAAAAFVACALLPGAARLRKRLSDDGKPYKECRDCGTFLDISDPFVPPA